MKDQVHNRWMAVGIIWALVIGLLCWNEYLMAHIRREQKNVVYAQANSRFLESRAHNIAETIKKKESYRHRIVSLKLGLLSVEDQLNILAEQHGFSDVSINILPDQPENEQVPITISFKGTVGDAIRFMDRLQKDSPYIVLDKAVLKTERPKQEIHFSISFTYRYKLGSPEDAV